MSTRPLIVLISIGMIATPVWAQKDKKEEQSKETVELLKLVEEAAKAKDYRIDKTHGGGKAPYDDYPSKPGFLIGMNIWPGLQGKNAIIKGVQPIYETTDGKKFGGKFGWFVTPPTRVDAKAGYAVGGLKMHTSAGTIQGMSIVFFRVTETGLDKTDSYESKWFGHKDPTTAFKVGMDGNPVLGIHGMVHDDSKNPDFGLGLIMMGEKKKKK
jgi:hypothetical protein